MEQIHERLLELLGKPVTDAGFEIILSELGQPDRKEEGFQFPGLFICTDSARFSEVQFWLGDSYGEAWAGGLPGGISRDDRIADVERKLDKKTLFSRHLNPRWYFDRYYIYPHFLAFNFEAESERLEMLYVSFLGIFTDTSDLPASFSMRTTDGRLVRLFERGSEIPEYRSEVVSTTDDGQHAIEVDVFRDEGECAGANQPYARYLIHQVPQAPKGEAKIEVRFEVLIDGNLKVTAVDQGSRRRLAVDMR
jgi:hypothetical protein